MAFPILSGTATVTNGSEIVTIVGGNLVAAGVVGGTLILSGLSYPIDTIDDNDKLMLKRNYPGVNASGLAFDIAVDQVVLAHAVNNGNRLTELLAEMSPLAGYTLFSKTQMTNADAAAWRTGLVLGNVNNTSDANKPVSTAQQTALNAKLSLAGGTVTGATIFSGGLKSGTVPAAPSGSVGLAINYSGIHDINIFGAMRGSGNTMLGFATKPSTIVGNGFDSATSNASWARGALVLSNSLEFLNAASATVAIGSPVTLTSRFSISSGGAVTIPGSLSKGSGSFSIDHPLPELAETHNLVHSFVEAPTADLIYRGVALLVAGVATVNIDAAAGMTDGTFTALNGNLQVWLQNNTGWSLVRGDVTGNILTITAQDPASTDEISWLVVGERQDQHMLDTAWTDELGRVTLEPLKPIPEPAPEPSDPEPIEEA